MSKHKKRRKKPGSPPGTLIFTGEKKLDAPQLLHVRFDTEQYHCQDLHHRQLPEQDHRIVQWLDVHGIHDVELIERIGEKYNLHPLILEDILNPNQRPKLEEYDDGLFIVFQGLKLKQSDTFEIQTEQIGIFIKDKLVISFQEDEDDTFLAVRERIDMGRGKIRTRNSDYLAYAMIDSAVDNFFLVIDRFEEEIESLEQQILIKTDDRTKSDIHRLKTESIVMRKAIAPLREAINRFSRSDSRFVDDSSKLYLRDLADHTFQLVDLLETHRDVLNGLYDLYLSEISYRMNTVIQVLTVISTIFIPLTFLVGVYGMNFDVMPELHWKSGYFILWAIMIVIGVSMIFLFKKRKWL